MNQNNSPTSIVGQYLATPGRSWFDRSFPYMRSYPIGKIVPDACIPITGNTTVKLDITSMLQTNPTPTPVFDSCKANVFVFFCPQRLYVRGLQNDNYMELDEIEAMKLPFIKLSELSTEQGGINLILPGSLLHSLGLPASYQGLDGLWHPLDIGMYYSGEDENNLENIHGGYSLDGNFSSVLAYFDACMYFLANPYDPEIPFEFTENYLRWTYDDSLDRAIYSFGRVDNTYSLYNLKDLQNTLSEAKGIMERNDYGIYELYDFYDLFLNSRTLHFGVSGPSLTDYVSSGSIGEDAPEDSRPYSENANKFLADILPVLFNRSVTTGLFPATYMEDFQSTFFDNKDIQALNAVPLAIQQSATVESARIQKSVWHRMLRSILRGKRLSDWTDIQFGRKLSLSNHPIMVGYDSFNITWNDVLSHNANNGPDSPNGVPLGASAGRGYGGKGAKDDKTISFTAQEPGYLLICRSIVPFVSYANNKARHWDYTVMADFPLPMYSGTQFQDLCVSDITMTNSDELNNGVIGKQPLYYDHMVGQYTLGGLFATDFYDSYVFKRAPSLQIIDDPVFAVESLRSTYVIREMYDFQFTDWSQNGGENIFIKSFYNLRCFQPLDKQVIKTRL